MALEIARVMRRAVSKANDYELIRRIQAGEGRAWGELCGRLEPVIRATASEILPELPDQVDEIVYEISRLIWDERETLDSASGIRSWVEGVARQRSRDRKAEAIRELLDSRRVA